MRVLLEILKQVRAMTKFEQETCYFRGCVDGLLYPPILLRRGQITDGIEPRGRSNERLKFYDLFRCGEHQDDMAGLMALD